MQSNPTSHHFGFSGISILRDAVRHGNMRHGSMDLLHIIAIFGISVVILTPVWWAWLYRHPRMFL